MYVGVCGCMVAVEHSTLLSDDYLLQNYLAILNIQLQTFSDISH